MGQEGTDTQMTGYFYVLVVQAILLSRSETWAVTPCIKRLLWGFHHRLARWILGNIPLQRAEGKWEYPPLGDEMKAYELEEIETYISR